MRTCVPILRGRLFLTLNRVINKYFLDLIELFVLPLLFQPLHLDFPIHYVILMFLMVHRLIRELIPIDIKSSTFNDCYVKVYRLKVVLSVLPIVWLVLLFLYPIWGPVPYWRS